MVWAGCLPRRVCCVLSLETGLQILVTLAILLRAAGTICACFYGPYIYLALPLGGLFLAGDISLLVSLFRLSEEGKYTIDFPNQRVWIIIWQVANVIAVLGLIAATCWFLLALGMWGMLYTPIHFTVFLIICLLVPLLIYISFILLGFFTYLKEAYIETVLGQGEDEEDVGHPLAGRQLTM